MESEDILSSTDIFKHSDAVVREWFGYKVNFGDVIKQQNLTFEVSVVSRKIKLNSDVTFTIVNSYKLYVL